MLSSLLIRFLPKYAESKGNTPPRKLAQTLTTGNEMATVTATPLGNPLHKNEKRNKQRPKKAPMAPPASASFLITIK